MNGFSYRRSLIAIAVAACTTSAYAQTPCDPQIRQLEQQVQQGKMAQQQKAEVRDLLQAAEQNPSDCNVFVARAEELMRQTSPNAGAQTAQPATPPSQSQAAQQQPKAAQQQPKAAQQQSKAAQQQSKAAQQPSQAAQQPSQEPVDRTMDIQVDQAPAQVDVQTRSPQIVVKQQPAEVTVEQKPPEVEITQSKPEIEVQQPKPNVQVNKAQPDVQVTQSDPKVEVKQSEPNVRVVQPEATAQVQGQQSQTGQRHSKVNLEDVQGQQALSSTGEEIGEVQNFVRSRTDGSAHALIGVGGVLGVGGRTIAIPLEQASVNEQGQLQTQLSQNEIEQQEEYDEQRYEQIQSSEFAALEAQLEPQP